MQKTCKGQGQEISPNICSIIKPHSCPQPTVATDFKLSVCAKAKELQQSDKTKKARAVILPLLKAAEAEFPGASLPKPDNIVRNVNCARSVKFP